jgi:hypothetical protein
MDQLYLHIIESLKETVEQHHEQSSDAFKEIRADLKEIRRCQETDLAQLKVQQASCAHKWSLLGKVASLGGFGTIIATMLAKIFGVHP